MDVFGEVTAKAEEGAIFVEVNSSGFGCGVFLSASDARALIAQLKEALQELQNYVQD